MIRLHTAAVPGFKSRHQSPSASPFLTPPIISYTCQYSQNFLGVMGCHGKLGQVWPLGVEPTISKLSCRCCNHGELPPSYILGRSHSHLHGSQHSHSYLTYPWNQLKVIDMLNDCSRDYLRNCWYEDSSQRPCSKCPIPQFRLVGMRTSYIFNISWTPWVLNPITNPSLWGGWLHPVTIPGCNVREKTTVCTQYAFLSNESCVCSTLIHIRSHTNFSFTRRDGTVILMFVKKI